VPGGMWPVSDFLGDNTSQSDTNFLSATNHQTARVAINVPRGNNDGLTLNSNAVPFLLITNKVLFGFDTAGRTTISNTVSHNWAQFDTNGLLTINGVPVVTNAIPGAGNVAVTTNNNSFIQTNAISVAIVTNFTAGTVQYTTTPSAVLFSGFGNDAVNGVAYQLSATVYTNYLSGCYVLSNSATWYYLNRGGNTLYTSPTIVNPVWTVGLFGANPGGSSTLTTVAAGPLVMTGPIVMTNLVVGMASGSFAGDGTGLENVTAYHYTTFGEINANFLYGDGLGNFVDGPAVGTFLLATNGDPRFLSGNATMVSNVASAVVSYTSTNLASASGESLVNATAQGGYSTFGIGAYDPTLGSIFKNSSGVITILDDASQNGLSFSLHRTSGARLYDNFVSNVPEQENHYVPTFDISSGTVSAQYYTGNSGYLDAHPLPFNALDARCPVPYFAYNTFLDPNSGPAGIKPTATNIQTAVMFYSTNLPAWMKPFTIIWIDGGWAHTNRVVSDSSIMVDSNCFPNGLQATIDMIHASNYMAGLYTTFSPINCGSPIDSGPTTTMGYLKQDVWQMLGYGVNAMKIDQCNGLPTGINATTLMYDSFTYYAEVYRAHFGGTNQPIMLYTVFPSSMMNDDFAASQMNVWENGQVYNAASFAGIFNSYLPYHLLNTKDARIGHYNEGPLSFEYVDTNMFAATVAVCGMLPSPVTVGVLTNLAELYWVTNQGAWSVIRDPACLPMRMVYSNNMTAVYVRPLGSKDNCQSNAVLLVNWDSGSSHNVGFTLTNTALTNPNWVTINDVWTGGFLGAFSGTYTNTLAASSFQWVTLQKFTKPYVSLNMPPEVSGSATTVETVPGQPLSYIFGNRYLSTGLGNFQLPDPTPFQSGAQYGMTNITFTMTFYFTDSVPVMNLYSELDIWTNSTASLGAAWSSGTIGFVTNPGAKGTNAYTVAMGVAVPSNVLASAKGWGTYLYNNGTTNMWRLNGSITNW
jgi:hypothetical protein